MGSRYEILLAYSYSISAELVPLSGCNDEIPYPVFIRTWQDEVSFVSIKRIDGELFHGP